MISTLIGDPHALALAGAICCSAAGQVLFKIGAVQTKSLLSSYISSSTLLGCVFLATATILAVYALQTIEFKEVTAWTGFTHVLVFAAAVGILRERVSVVRVLGIALIVIGIWTFNL